MRTLTVDRRLTGVIALLALSGCGGHATTTGTDTAAPAAAPVLTTMRLRVPSDGMAPTLKTGQIITADVAAYRDRDPAIGDIVVFNPPASARRSRS